MVNANKLESLGFVLKHDHYGRRVEKTLEDGTVLEIGMKGISSRTVRVTDIGSIKFPSLTAMYEALPEMKDVNSLLKARLKLVGNKIDDEIKDQEKKLNEIRGMMESCKHFINTLEEYKETLYKRDLDQMNQVTRNIIWSYPI